MMISRTSQRITLFNKSPCIIPTHAMSHFSNIYFSLFSSGKEEEEKLFQPFYVEFGASDSCWDNCLQRLHLNGLQLAFTLAATWFFALREAIN